MAQLICNNLAVGYDRHTVRDGISFEINKGDYLLIVGENGSGKSTLMKTLLGLQQPISGKITYGDGLKKNQIGYLPQQTDVQKDFPASVYEVVISGFQGQCGLRPFYTKSERIEASAAIEKMGIASLAKRCYRELSGGQQQRALLARALCATKTLLLLDEPIAGLDPQATEEMYSLIHQLNADGITVIMISHDVANASKYASCILHVCEETSFERIGGESNG